MGGQGCSLREAGGGGLPVGGRGVGGLRRLVWAEDSERGDKGDRDSEPAGSGPGRQQVWMFLPRPIREARLASEQGRRGLLSL